MGGGKAWAIGGKTSQETRLIRLDGPWQTRYLCPRTCGNPAGIEPFRRGRAGSPCPMDSFEWNKIIGAVLFALLVTFGLGIFSGIIFETEAPETPGYVVAVATPEASGGSEAPAPQPIAVLLASADPKKGEAKAKNLHHLPRLHQGRTEQDRPQPLRRRRPADRVTRGLRIRRRDEEVRAGGQHLDLRPPEHLHPRSEGDGPRHQDGLRRTEERPGAGRRHRLSPHALRQSVAFAGSGRGADGDKGRFSRSRRARG